MYSSLIKVNVKTKPTAVHLPFSHSITDWLTQHITQALSHNTLSSCQTWCRSEHGFWAVLIFPSHGLVPALSLLPFSHNNKQHNFKEERYLMDVTSLFSKLNLCFPMRSVLDLLWWVISLMLWCMPVTQTICRSCIYQAPDCDTFHKSQHYR